MQRDIEKREWLLRRNCSLTPRQTVTAYAALCALSLGVALVFLLQGVWQVLVFTAIELAAVTTAFILYARHASDYEHIVLTAGCLLVERVSAGRASQTVLEPYFTRVAKPDSPRSLVLLEAKGTSLEVGVYAPDAQRRRLAQELQDALLDQKR
ncbi:DUF2244 domain-containing protein [Duganella sp. FT92W]|uniref:DUF2244 domain-containing protein n=1 Tax=Pseudoduganella rivuli TaxID=2666085 RepID=A0A7X2LV23_9BURK|nr:DUF2244 domain-containing protein [Pseudoduganella rivuli]MRV76275.1 DUF2244 domain-containing protein [Pseudoduganella rivuli]